MYQGLVVLSADGRAVDVYMLWGDFFKCVNCVFLKQKNKLVLSNYKFKNLFTDGHWKIILITFEYLRWN